MKTILFFLLFTLSVSAQTLTEKWNNITKQYEYYNSNGDLVGYKKYNSINKSWEYYDANPQPNYYTPKSNINVDLTKEVLAQKQKRYNYNVQLVKNRIDELYSLLDKSELTQSDKAKIKSDFYNDYLKPLEASPPDFSDDNVTALVLKNLLNGFSEVINR